MIANGDSDIPPDDESVADDESPAGDSSESRGRGLIRRHLATLGSGPGVYRMLDARGELLYVGKARNLKRRVAQYANGVHPSNRIARMVAETTALEVIVTHTEAEALLLEANMIKRLKPRYNVLLRDDKSFPYIVIAKGHAWARLGKHRGARGEKGSYFGPFASAGAVTRTLNDLQRVFLLRSCSDSMFESRSRPCLLYQIKRCAGPCVDLVSKADYDHLVEQAEEFLGGRSQAIQRELSEKMTEAAEALDYERAAIFRDRIKALTAIQAHQDINTDAVGEADVIALHVDGGQACVQVFFFRGGQNWGNRAYYPRIDKTDEEAAIRSAFIAQFYDERPPPRLILVDGPVDDAELLIEALSAAAERRIEIAEPKRGAKADLVEHARTNAREALGRRLAETSGQAKLLQAVAEAFDLEAPPKRIEVYDNSHVMGTNAVGGMIVAGPEGFMKNAYRKFNIRGEDITPGDDFGMMREVLTRRFKRLVAENPDRAEGGAAWPDLLLIDGGAGQVGAVVEILRELGVEEVPVVGIAKGPDRNAGRERFFRPGRPEFSLEQRSPVLYFLQRLRDEAHRFAIGTHRAKRGKAAVQSVLDEIPGIGPSRKKALLHHFGSAKAAARAGLADLEKVPGISKTVAKLVYDHFNEKA
ncbi:excinuclease ABC subunit UvrC [Zavarzinia aquatilis]|uniref:UvrABC system protein C n=1 Tax=Zavarzinia aquatilis TaxID=2211142 RepID=A0A317DV09_9PROT|nr:excinuclease ABC subunit UvrC [Zavarzinia aquatilis]PWR18527.1 excinuclease ABC subunit C [Zavarzinia aquatilis]